MAALASFVARNAMSRVQRVTAALAIMLALIASTAMAQSIQQTATDRERIAMPLAATFEAELEDMTRDPARILANNRHIVHARIVVGEKPLFINDTAIPVSPTSVSIMLRRVGGQIPPASGAGNRSLEGTYWKATELAGKATPAQDAKREAHLVFQTGGRVSGSDGCNRITGTYELKGTVVTFGQFAGTQMACVDSAAETERAFRGALTSTMRLAIAGDRLDLFDAAGNRMASFTASAQASVPTNTPAFAGRSWQLVKFQGSDGTTLTPDDRAKYTIEFASDGQLTSRVDCNRGRGTWKSSGPNQVQFGPLALTRAMCPAGSLHDHIVKQWNDIRSYVMKDGHLFLSLMADGGIYEFEPLTEL